MRAMMPSGTPIPIPILAPWLRPLFVAGTTDPVGELAPVANVPIVLMGIPEAEDAMGVRVIGWVTNTVVPPFKDAEA